MIHFKKENFLIFFILETINVHLVNFGDTNIHLANEIENNNM